MDRVCDPLGELGAAACLDSAAQLVHLAHGHELQAVLLYLREATDDRLDRAREDVHPEDRDHVVHAARDSAGKLERGAAAGAAPADATDAVAGAIPDDRHPPAPEVCHDELALALVGGLTRRRIDDLRDELGLVEMHAVARLAGEAVRADLSGAGMVERRDAELRLDPLARRRDRCPGLAGLNRYAH